MRVSKFIALTSVFLICFVVLVFSMNQTLILSFDERIIGFANQIRSDSMTTLMRAITELGSWKAVVLILLLVFVYLLTRKFFHFCIFMIVVNAISPILNTLLKNSFERPRPNVNPYYLYDSYSFPSGHATAAMVLFLTLCFLMYHIHLKHFKPLLIISILLVLSIGFSRVYLGVHYPSDVLGGYLMGTIWFVISIFVFDHFGRILYFLKK